MIDCVRAGADGGLDALGAMRVRSYIAAPTRSFNNGGAKLLVRILLSTRGNALGEHGPRRQDLDEVRAILEIRAHGLGDLRRTIGQVVYQRDLDVGRKLQGIARAPRR